jgi:hypothetical protein
MNEDRSIYDGNNQNNFRRFLGRDVVLPVTNPPTYVAGDEPNPLIDDWMKVNYTDPATGLTVKVNQCFGSGRHTGLCLFVFGDGSVRGVKTSASIDTLTFLGLPNDGIAITWDY